MRLAPVFVLSTALLSLGLTGCSVVEAQKSFRGQTPDQRDVAELVPGVSTKADVREELGTPTNVPSFDDSTWLYLGSQTRLRIARTPGIIEQSVTVVRFDQTGTLLSIGDKQAPDGMQLSMAAGATPSPGSSTSFFAQLIGNIGRFSPTGGGGSGQGSSPLSGFASTNSSNLGEGGTTPGTQ